MAILLPLHRKGQEAEKIVVEARNHISDYLKTAPGNLYFTSGGTECSNTSIIGAAWKNKSMGRHILTARGEHPATAEPLKMLAEQGWEIEYLDLDENGRILADRLKQKLRKDTVLVTCLHVNNETGVIHPVDQMGGIIKKENPRTLFHVDAVQSFAKLPLDPEKWQVDLMSSSAHKFHGPKGVGCLYIRKGLVLHPYIMGGGQERRMRSGTENVAGIAGMGEAVREAYMHLNESNRQVRQMKLHLAERLLSEIDGICVNGPSPEESAAHVLNLQISGCRSEVLLHALEEYGIFISSGSACASNRPQEKSPALSAIGLDAAAIDCSVRISFSSFNTMEEMDETVEAFKRIVPMLRRYQRG